MDLLLGRDCSWEQAASASSHASTRKRIQAAPGASFGQLRCSQHCRSWAAEYRDRDVSNQISDMGHSGLCKHDDVDVGEATDVASDAVEMICIAA